MLTGLIDSLVLTLKSALFQLLHHFGNIVKTYQILALKHEHSIKNKLLWAIEHSTLIFETKTKKVLNDGKQPPTQRFTLWSHQIAFMLFKFCRFYLHHREQWKYINRRYRWKEISTTKIQWVVVFWANVSVLIIITYYIFLLPLKTLVFTCSKSIKLGKLALFGSETSKFSHVASK